MCVPALQLDNDEDDTNKEREKAVDPLKRTESMPPKNSLQILRAVATPSHQLSAPFALMTVI